MHVSIRSDLFSLFYILLKVWDGWPKLKFIVTKNKINYSNFLSLAFELDNNLKTQVVSYLNTFLGSYTYILILSLFYCIRHLLEGLARNYLYRKSIVVVSLFELDLGRFYGKNMEKKHFWLQVWCWIWLANMRLRH